MIHNWKRFSAFLLLLVMLVTTGCSGLHTGGEDPSQNTTSQDRVLDPDSPYLLLATDLFNGRLIVVDLDKKNPMRPETYYWEWKADADLGWTAIDRFGKGSGSDAKLRWSEFHQSYVVLVASSLDMAGIIEYPSGKCLWEAEVPYVPHAIEMMPNGDVVIAGSGGHEWATEGRVMYYSVNEDGTYTMTYEATLPSAHGVLWDPEYQVLWALGYGELVAYKWIVNEDGKNGLAEVDGMGGRLTSISGHDLMPDYNNSDLLWITVENTTRKFSKSQNKFLNEFTYSDKLRKIRLMKGISSFADGAVAYYHDGETSDDWQDTFYVLWPLDTEGKDAVAVPYKSEDGAYWYKVRNFNPNYQ